MVQPEDILKKVSKYQGKNQNRDSDKEKYRQRSGIDGSCTRIILPGRFTGDVPYNRGVHSEIEYCKITCDRHDQRPYSINLNPE